MTPYTNWEAYGCEISPVAVRYARDTLGLPNVICGRLEEVDLRTMPSTLSLCGMCLSIYCSPIRYSGVVTPY
jgi:hypothetical protein